MARRNARNLGFECIVEGCEEEAVCAEMCSACYQYERKWAARTPAERMARRKTIAKWDARLERLSGPRLRVVR